MAIKVIKHGETKFRIICPTCGCEFEYEYEDLANQYGILKQVKCPDCGEWLTHRQVYPTYPTYPDTTPNWPWRYPNVIYCSDNTELDCEKCPNKPDPTKIIVGDTPCTWCKKNQPYCFTGDKFPSDYKGGSYSVNPEDFKNYTFTNNAVYTNFTESADNKPKKAGKK